MSYPRSVQAGDSSFGISKNKSLSLQCVTLISEGNDIAGCGGGHIVSATFRILYGSVPCGALMRPLLSDKCNATGRGTVFLFRISHWI